MIQSLSPHKGKKCIHAVDRWHLHTIIFQCKKKKSNFVLVVSGREHSTLSNPWNSKKCVSAGKYDLRCCFIDDMAVCIVLFRLGIINKRSKGL